VGSLPDTEHNFGFALQSNLYILLDHDAEVVVMKGKVQVIKKAAESMRALK